MIFLLGFFLSLSINARTPGLSQEAFQRGVKAWESAQGLGACQNDPETRIFCEEGFWFRDAFLQWAYNPGDLSLWPSSIPGSQVQAVSLGMAIPFHFKNIPESYFHLGQYSDYVVDGWGFMTGLLAKKKNLPPCPEGRLRLYCEFGRGRSSFFTNVPLQGSVAEAGLSFARSMHGGPAREPIKEITDIFRGKSPVTSELKICLMSKHFLDCFDGIL